jgi:hypothetical protein
MTTSTSQGRRVPFFLGLFVFLFFIALSLCCRLPITDFQISRFPDFQISKSDQAAACARAASCASAISPASKLGL